jgi:hypothetical protein
VQDWKDVAPQTYRPILALVALSVILADSSVAKAQAALDLPEPEVPPVEVVREIGESPLYYRRPPDQVIACGRTSLGSSWRSDQGNGESGWGFSIDILSGIELGFARGSRAALLLEGGYSYVREGEHLFNLGSGLVIRRFGPAIIDREGQGRPAGDMLVSLVPHFMIGRVNDELGLGLRTGISFAFWSYGVTLSHQVLWVDGRAQHEVQLAFSVAWRIERP